MEFDGISKSSTVVILNETKYNPQFKDIDELIVKSEAMQKTLNENKLPSHSGIKQAIPVLSGHYFTSPRLLRKLTAKH